MEKRKSIPTKSSNKYKENNKSLTKITNDDNENGMSNIKISDSNLNTSDIEEDSKYSTAVNSNISDKKVRKRKKLNELKQSDDESESEKDIKKEKKTKVKKIKETKIVENKKEKPKSKEKQPKKTYTDEEAYKKIKLFFIEQNRPYSVQNIVDLMGGHIKKTQCQKVLDKLLGEDVLILKEYNIKVYLANQNQFKKIGLNELENLDKEIEDIKGYLDNQKLMNNELNEELKNLCEELSDEELNKRINENRKKIQEIEKSINSIEDKKLEKISGERMKEVETNYEKHLIQYKKTKKVCNNILDFLLDYFEIKKVELMVISFLYFRS